MPWNRFSGSEEEEGGGGGEGEFKTSEARGKAQGYAERAETPVERATLR